MKNLVRALTLLSILLAVPAWAGDGVWTPAGPPGARGRADQLVLDPFSLSTLYLVYFGDNNSGAWKSTDRGDRWTSINSGIDSPFIFSLAPDPFVPGTLWALANFTTGESLRKSSDGGRTWTVVYNASLGSSGFKALAPDPRVAGTLWAWGYDDLFRSRDGGVSWESVARLGGTGEIHSLAFDPGNPDVLYIAGGSSLWKSTDAGAHWTAVSKVSGFGFDWVRISPSRPATLYARPTENFLSPQAGCVRSDDAGLTWTSIPFPNPDFCYSLVVDPGNYLKLWALSGNRLYTSEDGGATWAVRDGLPEGLSADLLRREPATGFLYTVGVDGPVRSADGGATWETVKQGLTQISVGPILALPGPQAGRTALLAAVRQNQFSAEVPLLRSRNRGRFWTEAPLKDVTVLARDPQNPFRVLAATALALHESRDGGATWTRVGATPDTAVSIAIHPNDSRRIYIGTAYSGVFQSRNGGRTWQAANNGLIFPEPCDRTFCPSLPTTELTFDPRNPDVLHAVFIGTLVRSVNGGRSWARVPRLQEGSIVALALDPRDSRILYAAGQFALFKSVDGGATWFRTDGDIEAPDPNEQFIYFDLAFDPRLGGILYAATYSRGVLRSRDGGATWEAITEGLPLLYVSRLEIDPNVPGGLFAVTEGAGIWQFRTVE
jgi:photosystem II stability/assembly factor-like uncharacterized protein